MLYPRAEVALEAKNDSPSDKRLSLGVPRLDAMVGGGVLAGTTTMLLGTSGAGKTTLGLHFLARCSEQEPGLLFGFYETPERLLMNAASLGLDLASLIERGHLEILWQPPVEQILDDLGQRLVEAVRRRGVRRLFVDGIGGYVEAADDPARLGSFFAALSNEFHRLGATALYTSETANLVGPTVEMPVSGISAVVENLLLLRFVELRARLYRLISVLKVRGSAFDPTLREFQITEGGIVLADTLEGAESILSGFGTQAPAPASQSASGPTRRKRGQG